MTWLLLLTACLGPSEKGFAETYAKQLCRYDEFCDKSGFVEDYDDIGECVDDLMDQLDDGADCDFDPKEARDCIAEMRDARKDCDADDRVPRPCFDAFDCPGVLPSKLNAETFYQQLIDVYCSLGCGEEYIEEVCNNVEDYTATAPDCPDFDIEKAEECLNPNNWECNDSYGYEGGFPIPPRACSEACYAGYYSYDYVDTGY